MWRYIKNIGIAIDQLVNTLAFGDPDETVSSRVGKAKRRGSKVAALFCLILNRIDPNHCCDAIEEDEG